MLKSFIELSCLLVHKVLSSANLPLTPGLWNRKLWKQSFFCGSGSSKILPLPLPHRSGVGNLWLEVGKLWQMGLLWWRHLVRLIFS